MIGRTLGWMRGNARGSAGRLVLAAGLIALALPASASAQASRTWVSGVGDDVNPCSRTAPCKTFAGAISKTAGGGQIDCLDPGGFGAVTITKSMTIKCQYTEGGVLVSGTNAIVVNAAATDKVVLRGLDIIGLGTGLNGIKVLSAASVKVLDNEIYGFTGYGIDDEPVNSVSKLIVQNSHIHDNTGAGVMVAPPASGAARVSIRHNQIDDNGCGVVSSSLRASGTSPDCGALNGSAGGAASVNIVDNDMSDHGQSAVLSDGSGSLVRIGRNTITGSLGPALRPINGGSLFSYMNNMVVGNPGGNGTTNGTVSFARKRKRSRRLR